MAEPPLAASCISTNTCWKPGATLAGCAIPCTLPPPVKDGPNVGFGNVIGMATTSLGKSVTQTVSGTVKEANGKLLGAGVKSRLPTNPKLSGAGPRCTVSRCSC